MCAEITYPFPNFNGWTGEVLEIDKQFHPTLYWVCDYLFTLGLKLILVSINRSSVVSFTKEVNPRLAKRPSKINGKSGHRYLGSSAVEVLVNIVSCGLAISCGTTCCCLVRIDAHETHYSDVIMGAMASQITSLTIVYLIVYSGADQRKHQNFASLAFVGGIHRSPVNHLHKGPVTRKMFPFDDVMCWANCNTSNGIPLEMHGMYCTCCTFLVWKQEYSRIIRSMP